MSIDQSTATLTQRISAAVAELLPEAAGLLSSLIAVPSLSGAEREALDLMERALDRVASTVERASIPDSIRSDPDYAGLELGLEYEGRHNLFARMGDGAGASLILQTHLDVVPAADWPDAFAPVERNGVMFGRGACDCKGQAATLWLALAALDRAGIALNGSLCAQFVVEEEIGGNGALAAVLSGERADAAVILEPTAMQIHPACRGACWFRIRLRGRSVHMGRKQEGVSALEKGMAVVEALRDYEQRLVAESSGQPLFERYDRPVQVNVGVLQAGEWPSMVPAECVIEGGVGFLPNKPMRVVQDELRALLAESPDPWVREHSVIDFPGLRNDAYAGDPNHPAALALQQACASAGLASEVFGWNVSCDARLYALRGGMPAIVFGPGDVRDAHSNHEQICIDDIAKAALALALFAAEWCHAG